jgi:predicted transposase/invertase (TIGR01784 family)
MDAYTLTKEEIEALDAIQEYDTIKNAEARGIEQERKKNKKEKIDIVKKLLAKNMSIDEITEITNLTKEEVEKISKN